MSDASNGMELYQQGYARGSKEAAAEITDLRDENARLLKNANDDAWLWSAYHEWCGQNNCAPSSGDLLRAYDTISAREAGKLARAGLGDV